MIDELEQKIITLEQDKTIIDSLDFLNKIEEFKKSVSDLYNALCKG